MSPPAAIPETEEALNRLNPVERDLLGLLGHGHTAKSIATLRSMSEAAVNERFRSARRKTGIGSSREIARLIVAQENRHEFIDLAQAAAPSPELRRPDAHRRASPYRWRLPMAAAVLIAAAILAQQTSAPPPVARPPIPAEAEVLFKPYTVQPDMVALHARMGSEPADPVWSPRTEAALSLAYHDITDPLGTLASLHVTCNASLCEVVGVSRYGLSMDEMNALTGAIQDREIHERVSAMDLDSLLQGFNSSRDDSAADNGTAAVFVVYWQRGD